MALKMIDAPPLNAVALGVVDYIWAVEARGFSVDGNLLLVKATYTDSAFSLVPTRTAFWIYDLTLGTYTVCVNDLIAVDRPLEVTDVVINQSSGQTQLVASYHDTGVSSELDPNKLALIRNSVLIQGDLVAALSGNQADASIAALKSTGDGRFVVLETSATNLVVDLDTNGCKDIFVLDLLLNTVQRITSINGAESGFDSLLGDARVGADGGLSVAFQSTQAFTTQDANAATDVFVWRLAAANFANNSGGSTTLISRTTAGAVGGSNPLLNSIGVLFDSDSSAFISSDQNNASDVWQSGGGPVVAMSSTGVNTFSGSSSLVSSSGDGRYVALVTASPELVGPYGVEQLVVLDTTAHSRVVVSVSAGGATADDSVISPVLSADGSRIAFSSQASNLTAASPDGQMHLYLVTPNAAGAASINGTLKQGQSLTAVVSDPDGVVGAVAYQWRASGIDIAGATSANFLLGEAQVGATVTVKTSYTDGLGTVELVNSAASIAVVNLNDTPTGIVAIGGVAIQGQTLTATQTLADADGIGGLAYQWMAGGQAIAGANGGTLLLTSAQIGKTVSVVASYTDGHGTPESVASAATLSVQTGSAPGAVHGIVYQWKSHMLLQGVSLAVVGSDPTGNEASSLLQFKNLSWDVAGHGSVDVYSHTAVAFQEASFALDFGAATGVVFTADAGLPADWALLSNTDPDTGHLLVAGLGFSGFVGAGDIRLGTVKFETGTQDHATAQLLSGAVGGATASNCSVGAARGATDSQGGFALTNLVPGAYAVTASRATADSGSAVTSADALAALRIAVGLNPNLDPDGTGPLTALPVSPYQFIAADVVGTDGRITSADALAILRMAVKLPTAPAKEWVFVEESRDFWDETTGKFTLDRTHASWDHAISANLQSDQALNLVGVLKGDVNGSWAAPAGSVDLDAISPQYFTALHDQLGMPVAQFGVYP